MDAEDRRASYELEKLQSCDRCRCYYRLVQTETRKDESRVVMGKGCVIFRLDDCIFIAIFYRPYTVREPCVKFRLSRGWKMDRVRGL